MNLVLEDTNFKRINGGSFFMKDYTLELEVAKSAAREAGKKIMEVYALPFAVEIKKDASPVTQADKCAEKIILEMLLKEFPMYGVLSEETEDTSERLTKEYVWTIDPLDGTKEFVAKNGEFTVNIALVHKHEPVVGVIYAPVLDQLYYAAVGKGSFLEEGGKKHKLTPSAHSAVEKMFITMSRSHATQEKELVKQHKFKGVITSGSSLKGCLVASGKADVYYRFTSINEWDICAMDCIVTQSGALITDFTGKKLSYNKSDIKVPPFLCSNHTIHSDLLKIAAQYTVQ